MSYAQLLLTIIAFSGSAAIFAAIRAKMLTTKTRIIIGLSGVLAIAGTFVSISILGI